MVNMDQFQSLLLPILIILIIGILTLGGWLFWVFTRRRDNAATVSAQESQPTGSGKAVALNQATPSYLLGITRSKTGEWNVYVDGTCYKTLAQVPDPQLRSDVMHALRQAAAFVGKAKPPASVKTGEPGSLDTPGVNRPTGSPASSRRAGTASRPQTRRFTSPNGMMPTIDLAHEIGEIVDELITQTPALEGHAVTLQNIPTGGLSFIVDGAIYTDITEIPNPEIQALIHRATREWERR